MCGALVSRYFRAGEVFVRKLRIAFFLLQRAEFFVAGVVGEIFFLKVLGLLSALLAGRLGCVVVRVTLRPQLSLLIPMHAVVGCWQYRMDYFLCVFIAGSFSTVLQLPRLGLFCLLPEEVLGPTVLPTGESPLCLRPMCRSAVVAAPHVSRRPGIEEDEGPVYCRICKTYGWLTIFSTQ